MIRSNVFEINVDNPDQLGLPGLRQSQPTVQIRPLEDFGGDLEAWSNHVDEYRKFKKLTQEVEALKANLIHPGVMAAQDVLVDDVPVILVEDPPDPPDQPYQAPDQSLNDSSPDLSFELLKGNRLAKNPGKLVVGKSQQFLASRHKECEMGQRWYYQCARKHEGRGKGKGESCSAQAIIDVDPLHEEIVLVKAPRVTDHNHVCDEGRIVKWKMMMEMERRVLANLTERASVIRKAVVVEYREMYKNDPRTWGELQILLAEDTSIDHRLYDFKQRALGNIPR